MRSSHCHERSWPLLSGAMTRLVRSCMALCGSVRELCLKTAEERELSEAQSQAVAQLVLEALARRRMSRKNVDADFEKAIEKALVLGKSKDAIYLPGWCGPASDD